ncbi:MAG: hypothetical protein HON14_10260 [Rhodospirillaceae bacterium]|jgi:hypothetical protein|nr:hypothetical protein [Rhodospirillaceae bacterium]MBT4587991.1 hypothetical protein [Rhodospirillaceae bacterium]MBT4939504.1 hypothetical protein [Rhodospirillaceae bacterium]MBT7267092.1 hypothetical protein [Rhodospirillaceae bacterium]
MVKRMSKGGLKWLLLGGLSLVLAACGSAPDMSDLNPFGKKYPVPACPKIQLLKDTDTITAYRPGPGRDITDIRFEADLKGFTGECEYVGKDGVYSAVNVTLKVGFDISRGPAEKSRTTDVSYFIAIPEFYPKPAGRQLFTAKVRFPENRNTMRILDEEVEISIPLNTSRKGPGSKIYIGFQLTPEQISFNRQKRQVPKIR